MCDLQNWKSVALTVEVAIAPKLQVASDMGSQSIWFLSAAEQTSGKEQGPTLHEDFFCYHCG